MGTSGEFKIFLRSLLLDFSFPIKLVAAGRVGLKAVLIGTVIYDTQSEMTALFWYGTGISNTVKYGGSDVIFPICYLATRFFFFALRSLRYAGLIFLIAFRHLRITPVTS